MVYWCVYLVCVGCVGFGLREKGIDMLSNLLIELDCVYLVYFVVLWWGYEVLGVWMLVKVSGVIVMDVEGKELLDGFVGLWCVNVGYGYELVVEVVV